MVVEPYSFSEESCWLSYPKPRHAAFLLVFILALAALAQSGGSSTVTGTILDPSGAVVPGATVEIHNPVSGFDRSATTDSKGSFTIANVPFNPYHLSVNADGFASYAQDIDVRSVVSHQPEDRLDRRFQFQHGHRRSRGRSGGERFHLPHRRRSRTVQPPPAGKFVVFGEFSGDVGNAGRRCRFQRPLPRIGRSRGKLLFCRRPAHHRSAKQGLLQPDSRRTPSRISKSFPERLPPNSATRPAWSSKSPPAPAREPQLHTAASPPLTARSALRTSAFDLAYGGPELGKLHRRQRTEYQPLSRSS